MKQIYKKADNSALVFDNSNSELAKKTANQIRAFYGLQELLNRYTSGRGKVANVSNEMLNGYIQFFLNLYQNVLGFAYQGMIASFPDIIVDDLLISFAETGGDNVKKTYQRESAKEIEKTIKTQDVSLTAKVAGGKGNILANFSLPGISVKLGGGLMSEVGKTTTIKIKGSGTLLSTLLHDIDNETLAYFYNMLASYNHKNKLITSNPISTVEYEQMWSVLKIALAINGLVGQMNQDDFSYYFIIGKKVITLPELINYLSDAAFSSDDALFAKVGLSGGKTMRLEPSQVKIRERNEFKGDA